MTREQMPSLSCANERDSRASTWTASQWVNWPEHICQQQGLNDDVGKSKRPTMGNVVRLHGDSVGNVSGPVDSSQFAWFADRQFAGFRIGESRRRALCGRQSQIQIPVARAGC